jgi:hypothetical protein
MAGRDTGAATANGVRHDDRRAPHRRTGAGAAPWAEELLDHLLPAGRDVRRVVAWLADAADASVSLRDTDGTLLAGPPLPPDADPVADVAARRVASAALETAGRHLRLFAVGPAHPGPAAVLAVARAAPFDRDTADLVTRTAGVVDLLLTARRTTAAARHLAQATADLRLAILQLLMVEDTVSARRVAAGLWPGLLDTDSARLYVLESRREDRDRLAEECLAATAGQALVVRCPAVDAHVIVLAPGRAVGERLRALVRERPGTYLGGSARHGLARTATAYGQAVGALAVARFRPDGAALHAERTRPEQLLDPAALYGFTARLLRPLDGLPHHTRAELLATTRLGLEFTAVNAARVLGVSRNTVRARMDRVAALLRADLSALTVRAAVHLALNAEAALEGETDGTGAGAGAGSGTATDLAGLLAGEGMRVWARQLLDRLTAGPRDLRATLRAWIIADGNAERAARLLGVHAQTVREHVRCAEPVLERRLLAGGGDLYEVVLAHLAAGDLDPPALPAGIRDSGPPVPPAAPLGPGDFTPPAGTG